jgi:hypothetical protein
LQCTHLDVPLHALEVKTDSLLVKVAVLLDLKTRVFGDRDVVSPSRSRQVKSLGAGEESSKESGTDTESTGTRDGLGDGESVLDDWLRVFTVS